ncbi:MAG: preprotein translocase subunit SecG [bacterium]|nr:preprotein translocase subunit SecG [bacterium]
METILLIIHVIICIVLVVSILLQSSKGGGLSGGAFGGMGGGGGAMFGGGGANAFLARVTTYIGIVFALTCIGLWYTGRGSEEGLPQTAAEKAMRGVPVQSQAGPQPLQLPIQVAPTDRGATGGN